MPTKQNMQQSLNFIIRNLVTVSGFPGHKALFLPNLMKINNIPIHFDLPPIHFFFARHWPSCVTLHFPNALPIRVHQVKSLTIHLQLCCRVSATPINFSDVTKSQLFAPYTMPSMLGSNCNDYLVYSKISIMQFSQRPMSIGRRLCDISEGRQEQHIFHDLGLPFHIKCDAIIRQPVTPISTHNLLKITA